MRARGVVAIRSGKMSCTGFFAKYRNRVYVVTAAHCVIGDEVWVSRYDIRGRKMRAVKARGIYVEKGRDMAILDISPYVGDYAYKICGREHEVMDLKRYKKELKYNPPASSRVDTFSFAASTPNVLHTFGYIIRIDDDEIISTLSITFGSSGSPLLCSHGEVIGVNVAMTYESMVQLEYITFSVPLSGVDLLKANEYFINEGNIIKGGRR